jgi:molybdopterin molybdotransferase
MSSADVLPTPAQAEAIILSRVARLPIETRPLARLTGAVLAEPVHAERDLPPFDRATMDGIAFASDAWRSGTRRFRIAGTQAAGRPQLTLTDPGTCLEIMTGAALPRGCDCIVPVERIRSADGWAELPGSLEIEAGMNIHTRGLDCRAGELLLQPGTRLGAPELAVLASAGRERAAVRTEPRIVVVTTGDELVEPGRAIEPWQVRRSNAHALRAAIWSRGYTRIADDHLPDQPGIMHERLTAQLATHDVVILTGGVSMGRYDHVPRVLEELGVNRALHWVAQRPGKPLWFGVGPDGQAVFGLPGNPVSSLVCLVRYVLTALLAASGAERSAQDEIRLGADFHLRPALTFFLPVSVASDGATGAVAFPRPTRGSGDFVSLLGTDGFVELPPGPADYTIGHVAPFYRW